MKYLFNRMILFAIGMLSLTGCMRIKPDEIGVRTVNFGMGEGIEQIDFDSGYHRNLWPIDTWNKLPRTIQKIRFSKDNQGMSSMLPGGIQITSTDGDKVTITAEVLFRIMEGNGYRVLQESGPTDKYSELVRGLSLDAVRVLFGRLKTEAFYDEKSRENVRRQAMVLLNERLKPRGLELVDFLSQSIEFDPNYENLIKQKKLADQRVELEKAKSRAAEERGKVDKLKAETLVKIQKVEKETDGEVGRLTTEVNLQIGSIKIEAEKSAATFLADASLYKDQKDAEGLKLMKTVEAEGSKRMNEALVGGGGRNLVALKAIANLNLGDVVFPSTGFDWFNPYDMAIHLGAGPDPAVSTAPQHGDQPVKQNK